jgi:tRNA pseudouridine32 synthase/23S rRNA pseudouridine746 synthase
MLHAAQLVFPHPDGGERRISAPIPDDMRAVLDKLGLPIPEQAQSEQGRPETR